MSSFHDLETFCPEVVKAGERHKAAPRQIIGSPPPTAFSAARTAAPKGRRIQHLAGVFRKAGGHSVRLPGFEEQQVFPRFGLIKGIVHIPLPGYPVKEFCIPGQFKAVGGCAVRHEFFHGLLAVWRLLCPVCLGNFASHRPNNIGKPPSGQLRRLYRYGDRAPGNIFVYQPSSPPFTVIKW